MADEGRERRLVVLLTVLVEGGLIGLAWLTGWLAWLTGGLAEPSPLSGFRWDGVDALVGVAATLPPLVLFLVCRRWPVGPLANLDRFLEQVVRPLLAPCTLPDLIGISVLAGLGEEMLFRGVLQPAMGRWSHAAWAGVLAAAVLFGLLHAVTPTYAALAALMGVYLGWLFLLTGNLLTPVVVHGLYDFVALLHLIYGFGSAPQPPGPEPDEKEGQPEEADEGG